LLKKIWANCAQRFSKKSRNQRASSDKLSPLKNLRTAAIFDEFVFVLKPNEDVEGLL